ncbi:DUF559 domain-containing protein [Ktedonospora formicarum]|uniref:DUF559 domain-containing protein n=1 Tax=Ktedonospora formicarum TaxID=2778364 RepID=A0A8J3HWL1_9CHLR|nr:hypothetical protein KSX_27340 [Ktedonospora formicarum]
MRENGGIFEVDGEVYHSTAAKDHDRDRHFPSYGIRVVERYTANQCYTDTETVAREFLDFLKQNA